MSIEIEVIKRDSYGRPVLDEDGNPIKVLVDPKDYEEPERLDYFPIEDYSDENQCSPSALYSIEKFKRKRRFKDDD